MFAAGDRDYIEKLNNLVAGLNDIVAIVNDGNYPFPATQVPSADPNTLDDYEEGTWTILILFGGGSVGQAASTNTGRYTKIGNRVLFNGFIQLSAKGSSTGDATIGTLPFPSSNATSAIGPAALRVNGVTFADYPQANLTNNSSVIALHEITNAGAMTTLTHSDFSNTSSVSIGGQYTTG